MGSSVWRCGACLSRCGVLLLSLVAGLWAGLAQADTNRALSWLAAQQQGDGSYTTPTALATPVQATAEGLRAFQAWGTQVQPGLTLAQAWLTATPFRTTESLARQVIMQVDTGRSSVLARRALQTHQHPDGGFGDLPGYQSTPLDTAWALEAFGMAGEHNTPAVHAAVQFLLMSQDASGGWANGVQAPTVYTTALAMHALWVHRQAFAVAEALDQAAAFLLTQRVGAAWPDTFNTALALLALLPRLPDSTLVADNLTALLATQEAQGSWDNDVYSTALALRALALAAQPVPNPDLATLQGRVVDGDSGLGLTGVAVHLAGATPAVLLTDGSGTWAFTALPAGTYSLTLRLADYGTLSTNTTLGLGEQRDVGTWRLLKNIRASTGTVRGVVTDARTHAPLAGVSIQVDGFQAVSGHDGSYQLTQVPPGLVTLTASLAGYRSTAEQAMLEAGGVVLFSPRMASGVDPGAATLSGTITAAATGLPLAGVSVRVTGSTTATVLTDSTGNYRLTPLTPGTITIDVRLTGYDPVSASAVVVGQSQYDFSPTLYTAATTPPGANTSALTGVVLDASTNAPLAGATVTARHGTQTDARTTSGDGRFSFTAITAAEVDLQISRSGYTASDVTIPLTPLTTLDIGQVRLRPLTLQALLPDIVVTALDTLQASTDPQTLALQGQLLVTLANQGTSAAPSAFTVLVFYDADRNGRFEAETDLVLGSTPVPAGLAVQAQITVSVNVAGQLPFRDAPLTVWADSQQQLVELTAQNNVRTSASICASPAVSSPLTPVLKWAWQSSTVLPTYNQVMSMPVVAPLADTNGDGRFDQHDTPVVVFHTFRGVYSFDGVLRAVSGRDGQELWTVTNPAYRTNPSSQPAVADLDGDGRPEILALGSGGGLLVFDQTGQLKWSSPVLAGSGASAIAVADLDGDGQPEIIVGNTVLNANGTLRWQGTGSRGENLAGAWLSVVADLDLDGYQEVIAGGTAYDHTGRRLWQNDALGDGFAAIGNFDDTPTPEIVVVYKGRLSLLNAQGVTLWGPVFLPGGGLGGPPTVADMDGDGRPEIGVAGSSRYSVFDARGSLVWSVPIEDVSSQSTGSSVFDFDGDGRAEVVYADEHTLRLYRGSDGAVLFATANSSGTLLELPVLVDVDNDDHADLLVVANNYAWGSQTGIRVFSNSDNAWVNTRRLWNQHSYHVTNVNDDASIPRHEVPSWQQHNTYRLNTLSGQNPRARADLSVGALEIVDHGTGQSLSLRVRVGNGGELTPALPITVAWYQGPPASGGVALGTVVLPPLPAGSYQTVQLEQVRLAGTADLYAVIDPARSITECDESNNSVSVPLSSATPLASLVVSTDAPAYGPASPVHFQATVKNTGSVTTAYTLQLRVTDQQGALVTDLPPLAVTPLAGGAALDLEHAWDTGRILAGTYDVRGSVLSAAGTVLAEAVRAFAIRASAVEAPLLSVRVTTDRLHYQAADTVTISTLVHNLTVNAFMPQSRLLVTVLDPQQQPVFTQAQLLGDLAPGSLLEATTLYRFQAATPGHYTVSVTVLDSLDAVLASTHTVFEVQMLPGASVQGTVSAALATVTVGQTQTCTAVLTNQGSNLITGLPVQQVIAQLERQQVLTTQSLNLTLAPQATHSMPQSVSTTGFPSGPYACVLQANVGQTWVTLAFAAFSLVPPPNQAPTAHAGGNRTAFVGETVVLDGSGSRDPDGESLTYAWTLRSAPQGSTATLLAPTTATPSLVLDRQGSYVYQLVVNDGHVDSPPALVTVTVPNRPPVADAGRDQYAVTGQPVTVKGSQSADPDGDLLTYAWRLTWRADALPATSRLTDADLSGATTPALTFTPDVDGVYTLQLLVHDGQTSSPPAYVMLTASTPNVPPNARAGADQSAIVGALVLLDGRASTDPDHGPQPLSYVWSFATVPPGSALQDADIQTADRAQASFVPDIPGLYALNLHVADGHGSDDAALLVTVAHDVPPNARAGNDQTVLLGQEVHLDGLTSDDPDNGPRVLSFQWRFVSVASDSQLTSAALRGGQTPNASFTPDVAGRYVLALIVSDGVESASDQVLITVQPKPLLPIQDLTATFTPIKVPLAWTPVAEATSYTILRSLNGAAWTVLQTGYRTTTGTYTDTRATCGAVSCYARACYVVRWWDGQGQESQDSNMACVSPPKRR